MNLCRLQISNVLCDPVEFARALLRPCGPRLRIFGLSRQCFTDIVSTCHLVPYLFRFRLLCFEFRVFSFPHWLTTAREAKVSCFSKNSEFLNSVTCSARIRTRHNNYSFRLAKHYNTCPFDVEKGLKL